jgi:putative tricarboxylic transport membrane protein
MDLDITFIILGIISGVISGMAPGVGMAVTMIAAYPLFLQLEVFQIVQFYLAAILVSQFVGSVVATYFAIPGEVSSIPATEAGHSLFKSGKGSQAIFIAAYGSFIGGIVAFIFLWGLSELIPNMLYMFTTVSVSIILSLIAILLFISPCSTKLERYGFPMLGVFLGAIGEIPNDDTSFLNFGIQELQVGIPDMALLLGIYTLPLLFTLHYGEEKRSKNLIFNFSEVAINLKHTVLGFVYSIYGFIVGFIPGVGIAVVSNTSYAIQKRFSKSRELSLLSAESSNNSAAFSILLPLLIFGIPTSTSQAILYNVLLEKDFAFGPLSFTEIVGPILYIIFFTSVAGFILACPLAKTLSHIFAFTERYIYMSLAIVVTCITLYIGYITIDLPLYICTLIITFIFGYYYRDKDILRVVYFFIITPFLLENLHRLTFILNIF